jgi:hypothetical protein
MSLSKEYLISGSFSTEKLEEAGFVCPKLSMHYY